MSVDDQERDGRRRVIGATRGGRHRAQACMGRSCPGRSAYSPSLPKPDAESVYDIGRNRPDSLIIEVETLHHPGSEVPDEDIGLGDDIERCARPSAAFRSSATLAPCSPSTSGISLHRPIVQP